MGGRGTFRGKTAVITGASRGIGKEIALWLARDGANIVIAAKTAEPHPKLPGTIYTAAEEIEKAGGRALPCIVDVRNEESVKKCVDEAVKKFGGIDILVNNASAISLTGTLETDMKRYDLMHNINTRGTYIMSKYCLPHLLKAKNPHILNISPPLLMEPVWFANQVAYTMAKYGMSMCVLGMSEEFRPQGVAVNALWPLTSIWTAAMDMLSSGEGADSSRKPEIMGEAAYRVLSKNSREFTGNFLIDEEFLRGEGVTDFEKYAIKPGEPLRPDFFVPLHLLDKYLTDDRKSSIRGTEVDLILHDIKPLLSANVVKEVNAIYEFNIQGKNPRQITLDVKNGNGSIKDGGSPAADVQLTVKDTDFVALFRGKITPTNAFITKKLKIQGKMDKAMKLDAFLKKLGKSKL